MQSQNQNRRQKKLHVPKRRNQMLIVMAAVLFALATVIAISNGNDSEERTGETISSINEHLGGINEIVTDSREQLSEISITESDTEKTLTDLSETLSVLENNLSTIETGLIQAAEISENAEKENTAIHTSLTAVFERQEEIREHIYATNQSVDAILSDTRTENQDSFAETYDQLKLILSAVDEIHTDTKEFYEELVAVIRIFQSENKKEHTELAEMLTSMADEMKLLIEERFLIYYDDTIMALNNLENNVTADAGQNLEQISDSIKSIIENYETSSSAYQNDLLNKFTILDSGLTQYNGNVTEQMEQISTDIISQYQVIANNISENDNRNQEFMESIMNTISGKLDAVFQSVSSSKKLLVSALLTKTVSVDQDATFQEIYQGILDIPQELYIGVQEVPGTITYDYHYHADAAGNNTHADTNGSYGGCFTVPVYHRHSGSSLTGGGCYTTAIRHTHDSSCYTTTQCNRHSNKVVGGKWVDHYLHGRVYVYELECSAGHTFGSWGSSSGNCNVAVTSLTCQKEDGQIIGYSLGCGKNENAVECYSAGCGLADGQIIGAHIIYTPGAQTVKTADLSDGSKEETSKSSDMGTDEAAVIPDVVAIPDTSQDSGDKVKKEDQEEKKDDEENKNSEINKDNENDNILAPSVSDNNLSVK